MKRPLNFGVFVNNLITFLIVALAIFLLVRAINKLYAKPAPATPDSQPCPFCTLTVSKHCNRAKGRWYPRAWTVRPSCSALAHAG